MAWKLQRACVVNVEVMWLLGGARPDFHTISDFRKDNIDSLRGGIMKKEHNIIKFFMPIIAAVYCLLMAFLAAKLLKSKEFVLTENLLFTAVQLVEVFLTVFICSKIMPKLFSNCDSYKAKIPKFSIVIALLLIAPFIIILEYDFIYFIRGLITKEAVEKIPFVEKTDSAYVTLIESISAVFLAPIIEEFSFRYMAISPFKKKKSKIIAFLFTTLVFGIIHVRNFFRRQSML